VRIHDAAVKEWELKKGDFGVDGVTVVTVL
jgi:hypothetical protein